MANEQTGDGPARQDGTPELRAGPAGESASEMFGDREVSLASSTDAAGTRSDRQGGDLGGTSSHHRPSFSDPLPGSALGRQAADDRDDATGGHTPGPGSPEWMRDPVDRTIADLRESTTRAHARDATDGRPARAADGTTRPPDEARR